MEIVFAATKPEMFRQDAEHHIAPQPSTSISALPGMDWRICAWTLGESRIDVGWIVSAGSAIADPAMTQVRLEAITRRRICSTLPCDRI